MLQHGTEVMRSLASSSSSSSRRKNDDNLSITAIEDVNLLFRAMYSAANDKDDAEGGFHALLTLLIQHGHIKEVKLIKHTQKETEVKGSRMSKDTTSLGRDESCVLGYLSIYIYIYIYIIKPSVNVM
jgi:hypothetical protein